MKMCRIGFYCLFALINGLTCIMGWNPVSVRIFRLPMSGYVQCPWIFTRSYCCDISHVVNNWVAPSTHKKIYWLNSIWCQYTVPQYIFHSTVFLHRQDICKVVLTIPWSVPTVSGSSHETNKSWGLMEGPRASLCITSLGLRRQMDLWRLHASLAPQTLPLEMRTECKLWLKTTLSTIFRCFPKW